MYDHFGKRMVAADFVEIDGGERCPHELARPRLAPHGIGVPAAMWSNLRAHDRTSLTRAPGRLCFWQRRFGSNFEEAAGVVM